jgi:hypothetical protein
MHACDALVRSGTLVTCAGALVACVGHPALAFLIEGSCLEVAAACRGLKGEGNTPAAGGGGLGGGCNTVQHRTVRPSLVLPIDGQADPTVGSQNNHCMMLAAVPLLACMAGLICTINALAVLHEASL